MSHILLVHQKLIDYSLNTKMWRAIYDDNDATIRCLQKLFRRSAIPDIENQDLERNGGGDTPLIFAAWHGYMELVELLVQYGADIEARNNNGSTALIYAARNNWKEMLQFLIDNGANVDIQDKWGRTALMYTGTKDYAKITRILIAAGADPDIVNKLEGNTTAIDYAPYKSDFQEAVKQGRKQRAESIRQIRVQVEQLLDFYLDVAQVIAEYAYGKLRQPATANNDN